MTITVEHVRHVQVPECEAWFIKDDEKLLAKIYTGPDHPKQLADIYRSQRA